MITTAISYGVGNTNLDMLDEIEFPIQLGIYNYEAWVQIKHDLIKKLKETNINIRVVHLPINSLRYSTREILNIIDVFVTEFECDKFVIHPNKGIQQFLKEQSNTTISSMVEISIENFPYKSRKALRTPLHIHDMCNLYSNVKMTFDTSHADDIWFDYKIFSYLIDKISIIHLSNRIKTSNLIHTNFNIDNGDINLVGFVKDLRKRYNWSGELVLEYKSEYKHHLEKNFKYIERLIGNVRT
jgi:hypothetical protein